MRSRLLVALCGFAFLAFSVPEPSFARGGGGHGGGHSSGHYSSGHGSSHKGGHYKNPKTGDHYQRKGRSGKGSGSARKYSPPLKIHSGVQRDSHGRIERSQSAKQDFLRQHGMTQVPRGYQVDHIVPLYAGGRDDASNMQLLTVGQHHQKTKDDFQRYGR